MGEAEYLDGEMPQEDESETPQTEKANEGCQESSNKKDLQESAAKDDFSKEKVERMVKKTPTRRRRQLIYMKITTTMPKRMATRPTQRMKTM